MIKNKQAKIWFWIVISLLLFSLIFPHKTTYYCKISLSICARSLIPSVFIFMVLSRIMSHFAGGGFFSGKLTHLISHFLNLPESLIPSCILGLFCSAPSGAFAISKIYSDGLCTKKQAQRACVLANNCSAAFIFSIAGAMTGSFVNAAIIFISNIISVFVIYFLLFRGNSDGITKSYNFKRKDFSFYEILCESISSSAEVTVKICAYVLFFATFGTMLSDTVSNLFSTVCSENTSLIIKGLTCSFFEMTSGVICLGAAEGFEKILLIGSAVSFCGLSVIFQVKGIFDQSNLDCSPFILSRLLCSLATPLFILLLLFILPQNVISVCAVSAQTSVGFSLGDLITLIVITFLFFMGGTIISSLDKKHKK